MKIGILGGKDSKRSKDFQKFKAAAKMLDISVEYYRPADLIVEVDQNTVRVLDYDMKPIQVDGIVAWMASPKSYFELYKAFSYANIPCINSASSVRNSRNKLLTNLILNKNKLPQPKTIFMSKLLKIPKISLQTPIVFKKKNGGRGIGARKFNNLNEMNDFLEKNLQNRDIYLQEYIKNHGWDLRVIVIGNKVIGGIKKIAKAGEWRTHVAHGGRAEPCQLNDTVISMSLEATKALGLEFAGLDIMQDLHGNYSILEVNCLPGTSIFYEVTRIDITYEILKYLKQKILKQSKDIKTLPVNYFQTVKSKMKKTQLIMKNTLIKPYVPITLYLNLTNLKWMLNLFPIIVFKPDESTGGKNVGLIQKSDKTNKYSLHYETDLHENMNIDDIIQFIEKLASNKKFIIQKGIDLIKYNNNPVDVRVLIQKPYDNWIVTGIIAKIAAKNRIVTNSRYGSTFLPLKDVLKNASFSEIETRKLKKLLHALTFKVAETLNKAYPGLRELGLDIGVDNNLWPWILEVNTRPQYNKFKLLEDTTIYDTINKYHNIIHKSIAYYCKSEDASNNNDRIELATSPEKDITYKENESKIKECFSVDHYEIKCETHPCNCCILEKMIAKSEDMFETSLALFLEAENKKIQYLISKEASPEQILKTNEQMYKIIEKYITLKHQ